MYKEQKRKLIKALRRRGKTIKEVEQYIHIKELENTQPMFKNGDKVTLNIEKIKSDVNYSTKLDKYKQFVDSHINTVFTVKYDEKRLNDSTRITLYENGISSIWLWWDGDLNKVNN